MRRAVAEFAATLAALGAVTVYMQLQDPTSWLRLRLAEAGEKVEEWRARAAVDDLIESAMEEVGK